MKPEIRKAAIEAIKDGDIRKLRALKSMIGTSGIIQTYFQVFGSTELYLPDGSEVEILAKSEPEPIPGLFPNVSSIIVTFVTREDMEATFSSESTHPGTTSKHQGRRSI